MFQDIQIEQLMNSKRDRVLIDVRSPSEYEEMTIPGSLNIPLFTDEERAEIGTLYKQVSVEAAKERGLAIVSAKLPAFVRAFGEIEQPKSVFCWRGGMRSKTTATVLSLMGIHVERLTGGVRAYRHWVLERLAVCRLPEKVYVVNGNTGTGKTAILNALEEKGYPVINLEALAGHRGSIFGAIGMRANNQKTFESLLVQRMEALKNAEFVFIEGESNRIGRVVLPDFIIKGKQSGELVVISMPMEQRVRNILRDYEPWLHKAECLAAFAQIKRRLHTPVAVEIETSLNEGLFEPAIRLLLEHYYDPRYEHAISQYSSGKPPLNLDVNNVDEAVAKIEEMIGEQVLVR